MTASSQPILELDRVSLEYRLYTGRSNSLRDWVVALAARRRYQAYRSLWAVKDLTLRCNEGERIGIMGSNGAGKTSLLRLIAGIFPPTLGTLACRGHVVPLLELGLGFNAEMTGGENVILASVLMGKTRAQARKIIPQVIDFAQLQEFVDVPVKYYSSGMVARLAFSIAMETDPDILLLDEVFAVGDIHWVRMAEERVKSLLSRAKLVMMVSHNVSLLSRFCTRGLYIERGQAVADGSIEEVVSAFEKQAGNVQTRIVDNRATSEARIHWERAGEELRVRIASLPMLGESWVGLFNAEADRNGYVAYQRVPSEQALVQFRIPEESEYELRLYRWTPGGETLEASTIVSSLLTHS